MDVSSALMRRNYKSQFLPKFPPSDNSGRDFKTPEIVEIPTFSRKYHI